MADPGLLATVRAQVAARTPVDAREAASVEQLLAALDRLPEPFDEDADPTHVTGSAIVVGRRGVLLHRHKRLGIWLQPGGHIAPGARLVHVDVHAGGRGHTHLDLRYLLDGPDALPMPPPGESQEVAWFGWDEAIALADPGLAGALRALRPDRDGGGPEFRYTP